MKRRELDVIGDVLNCGGKGGRPGPCPKGGLSGKALTKGQLVRFIDPNPGEDERPMTVVEDRGDRVLVEHRIPGMRHLPTASYLKRELKLAD